MTVEADGQARTVSLPSGATVDQALEAAGITLGDLDRVDPPAYTVLTEGSRVVVTRVTERFEIEEVTIPFERQTVRNEALPEGETRLLQPGENGVMEITYRIVEEEGEEISRAPVKRVVLREPKPEIVMVGAQGTYAPVPIEGKLAYLAAGNAWLIEDHSGNRRPLVVTGDLDGRVFRLSPDGRWLLFSRRGEDEETINSLWVASTEEDGPEPFPLGAENVVHFADWSPDEPSFTVAYSTVEPSPAAPGWQANNDLWEVTFSLRGEQGRVVRRRMLIEPNAGGQYGWWGTTFAWAPDGLRLAYARADSVGLVPLREPAFVPLLEFTPYQTLSDWAWVPGVSWGQNGETLYLVGHGQPVGLENPAASPVFDLLALALDFGLQLPLAERVGMFAFPVVSPPRPSTSGEHAFRVAFLQALTPLESEDSTYRLAVMDRDGSNLRLLFPPEGEPGLEPQRVAWSPSGDRLALIYRGDLWVVDAESGLGQRLTGDGQAVAYDWKP